MKKSVMMTDFFLFACLLFAYDFVHFDVHAGVGYHEVLAVIRAAKAAIEIHKVHTGCKPNCLGTTGNCFVHGTLKKGACVATKSVVGMDAQCTYTILHLLRQIGIDGLKCRYAGNNLTILLDAKVEGSWMGVFWVDYVRNIHAGAHYVTSQYVKLSGIVEVDCHCCFSFDDRRCVEDVAPTV